MRIPFSKPYRAFPELDPFSDAQCRELIGMAQAHRLHWALEFAARASVMLATFFVAGLAVRWSRTLFFDRWTGWWLRSGVGDTLEIVLIFTALLGAPMMSVLVMRDLQDRRMIRRVLERGANCAGCRYSLLGLLEVEEGRVRCPECGRMNSSDPALRALVTPDGARA